tara:strand:+ start:1606 stop:1785 length:180 start_codon:yes stop_codon:yes gene_type:complete
MIAFFESSFSTIEASEAGCWEKHKKEEKQNRARAKFFIMFVLFAEFSQMLLFLKILVSL